MQDRGFVYGQQKMIAQYNCSGDWVFYIEGDEIYHENDLKKILKAMQNYLENPKIEALAFNFYHFYGNKNTYLDSPGWYRSEVRIIKNSIRSYAPDGLFWLVLDENKKGRYPRAKLLNAYCYHYGWARSEEQMNLKSKNVQKYWGNKYSNIDYSKMDSSIMKEFTGTHPKVINNWLKEEKGLFKTDSNYKLSSKQKKHKLLIKFEKLFGFDFSKKHYKRVK
jgi:hypothetical protein